MKYRMYEAGNREFLCVQLKELLELNLAGQISQFSFAKMTKKLVYLHPHDDAPRFLEALKATGQTPEFTYHYNPKITAFKPWDTAHGMKLQGKYNATQGDNAPKPRPLRIVVRVEGGNITGIVADPDLPGIELHAFVYDVDNEDAGDDMSEERELFETLPASLY